MLQCNLILTIIIYIDGSNLAQLINSEFIHWPTWMIGLCCRQVCLLSQNIGQGMSNTNFFDLDHCIICGSPRKKSNISIFDHVSVFEALLCRTSVKKVGLICVV